MGGARWPAGNGGRCLHGTIDPCRGRLGLAWPSWGDGTAEAARGHGTGRPSGTGRGWHGRRGGARCGGWHGRRGGARCGGAGDWRGGWLRRRLRRGPDDDGGLVRATGAGAPRAGVEAGRWTCRPSALGAHRSSLVPPPVAVPVAACRARRSSIVRNGVVVGPSPRRAPVRCGSAWVACRRAVGPAATGEVSSCARRAEVLTPWRTWLRTPLVEPGGTAGEGRP